MSQKDTTKPKKEPQKRGPKSKLTEPKAEMMIKLASKGASDEQVAEILDVCPKTIVNWQKKNEELLLSYRAAKAQANEMVEGALFKRAMGYEHEAVKMFFDKESLTVIKESYVERYPPDTSAAQFYLKNRDPERWKDRVEIESNNKNINLNSTESPETQLQRVKDMVKDEPK